MSKAPKIVLPKVKRNPPPIVKFRDEAKKKPGPKPTGNAKSSTERSRDLEERLEKSEGKRVTVRLVNEPKLALDRGVEECGTQNEAIAEALLSRFAVIPEMKECLDQRLNFLNEASQEQIIAYMKAKGWEKPGEIDAYFDATRTTLIADITSRKDRNKRNVHGLLFLRDLPMKNDILSLKQLEEVTSYLEEQRGKRSFASIADWAFKLFKHHCYFTNPTEAYRYYHIAVLAGAKIETYWMEQLKGMHALLTTEQRADADTDIKKFIPEKNSSIKLT